MKTLETEMTAYTGLVTLVQLSASTIGDKTNNLALVNNSDYFLKNQENKLRFLLLSAPPCRLRNGQSKRFVCRYPFSNEGIAAFGDTNVLCPMLAYINPLFSQILKARVMVLKFRSRKSANSLCGGSRIQLSD